MVPLNEKDKFRGVSFGEVRVTIEVAMAKKGNWLDNVYRERRYCI